MAEIEIRQILSELKSQRREIDRAIASLETVVNGNKSKPRKATIKRPQESLPAGNGAIGRVVPFVRGPKLSGG